MREKVMRTMVFLVLPLLVTGCPLGADLEDPETFFAGDNVLFLSDVEGVFTCDPTAALTSCTGSICHLRYPEGGDPEGTIELFEEGFESALLDRPASYRNVFDPENCPEEPELIIDTDNPSQSLLIKKLHGQQSCGNGMPYPHPANALSDEEIQCLEAWVEYEATRSGP